MSFFEDLIQGWRRSRLWRRLAVLELKSRYQGAYIGVFWVVLMLALKVGMLSIVYSMVLDKDIKEYVVFLSLGVLTWNFISSVLTNSTSIFIKAGNYLQQMKLPHSIFVFQNVYKEALILLMYQLFVIPVLLITSGTSLFSYYSLFAIVGYALIVINAFFVSMWMGWLSARFRDVQPFVSSSVMILFLITPVLWPPPPKFADSLYFILNPFYHLLELIRAPLIHQKIPLDSVLVAIGLIIVNAVICMIFYKKVKNDLVLWV